MLRAYFRRQGATDWCFVDGKNLGKVSQVTLPKFDPNEAIEYYFIVLDGKRIVAKSPKIYNARNEQHCDAPFARHAIMLTLECLPPGTNPISMSAGYAAKTIIGGPPQLRPRSRSRRQRTRRRATSRLVISRFADQKGRATPLGGPLSCRFSVRFRFLHFLGQRRNDREEIADHAEVGDAEDRRLGILVDGDDVLRRRHPGEMLDRAGDARGDVEIRTDHASGLADLMLVIDPSRIDRRARCADRAADGVREIADAARSSPLPSDRGRRRR